MATPSLKFVLTNLAFAKALACIPANPDYGGVVLYLRDGELVAQYTNMTSTAIVKLFDAFLGAKNIVETPRGVCNNGWAGFCVNHGDLVRELLYARSHEGVSEVTVNVTDHKLCVAAVDHGGFHSECVVPRQRGLDHDVCMSYIEPPNRVEFILDASTMRFIRNGISKRYEGKTRFEVLEPTKLSFYDVEGNANGHPTIECETGSGLLKASSYGHFSPFHVLLSEGHVRSIMEMMTPARPRKLQLVLAEDNAIIFRALSVDDKPLAEAYLAPVHDDNSDSE